MNFLSKVRVAKEMFLDAVPKIRNLLLNPEAMQCMAYDDKTFRSFAASENQEIFLIKQIPEKFAASGI
ncbi:hypothetical protein GKQ38_03425 [Candidatus Nanohaloarchaea archaeon]|nr:hypothetical protein GKQ38_03425 [Candidatus Nanohaloarchaea archaeon]